MALKKMRGSTSLTDLDKVRQHDALVDLRPIDRETDRDVSRDARFFDSSGYRICFGLFHVKILTYVLCTLMLQEIVLGLIFLLTHKEVQKGNINARIIVLMLCRIAQIPPLAVLYCGLYKYKRYHLIPFALSQVTIGPFADISTFMMLLERVESENYELPFKKHAWLNIVIPLLLYTTILIVLIYVLYRCFVYYRAWTAHDVKYNREGRTNTKAETLISAC